MTQKKGSVPLAVIINSLGINTRTFCSSIIRTKWRKIISTGKFITVQLVLIEFPAAVHTG